MATIEDVAKVVGVSASTVSRALSRPDMVSKGTRDRIVDVAQQLGYAAAVQARAVRSQSTNHIALLVTDLLNPFYASIAKGVRDVAESYDYNLLLYSTDANEAREERFLQIVLQQKVQGLLIVPSPHGEERLEPFADLAIIELDRSSGFPGVNSVLAENVRGVMSGVEHLIGLGHRKIGFIGGSPQVSSTRERLEGYKQAMSYAQLELDPAWVVYGHDLESGGSQATLNLLDLPLERRPSALFVGNSEMAAGVVLALRQRGTQMPRDLSVVAFDDPRWASLTDPPLTVVAQPSYEMGRVACEILFGQIQRDLQLPPLQIRLATQLIVRGSTARPA